MPAEDKTALRRRALAVRRQAHEVRPEGWWRVLSDVLDAHRGQAVAGYAPIRSEIDPLPALSEAARYGSVAMPVVLEEGSPLRFRSWRPGSSMVAGAFGAPVPESGRWIVPRVLVVPLVAFDRRGGRLGYGGGFYDRTLAKLRADGNVMAIGFAYAAQEVPRVPVEPTDMPLDLIVTERDKVSPG